MKTLKIIPIFLVIITCITFSQQCGWQWYGPYPQGNPLKDIYFIDSLNGLAVGYHGTIIKTTNGGIDWLVRPSGSNAFL